MMDLGKIELVKGDITKIKTVAIVNAANSSLMGGGGVDGAIHRAGGSKILEECMDIRKKTGDLPAGEAVMTTAGNLPCAHVIHTVGPVWQGGNKNEEQLLRNAYKNSLLLALEHEIKSIAFPNISTGVYRFPKPLAAEIAIDEVKHFLQLHSFPEKVIFVCFDDENYLLYKRLI